MSRAIRAMGVFLLVGGVCCCAPAVTLALLEGRVYEMVSPPYKAGYGVTTIQAAAPDGNSLAFTSDGGFAGVLASSGTAANEYLARRGPSGWSTISLQPPRGGWTDVSANMEYALGNAPLGPNAGVENYTSMEDEFLVHSTAAPETAESWEVFGGITLKRLDEKPLLPTEESASADLCHIVVGHTEGALLPAAQNTSNQLYDLTRGCDGVPPSLLLIGVNNKGNIFDPNCNVELGMGSGYEGSGPSAEQDSNFNAVAADGNEIFFTTGVEHGTNCQGGIHQLFVRVGGTNTLEVSRPLSLPQECSEVPCAGAEARASANFKGASEDGSRVFFTTTAPLATTDKDTGNDLYMATIGCPVGEEGCVAAKKKVTSITQISHAGEPAEVQGVVRIAPSGSRIYFVARDVLSEGAGPRGEAPRHGADNLYVYDIDSGKMTFVADVCSGLGRSGTVEDVHCPRDIGEVNGQIDDTGLWRDSSPEAQSAGQDARFLVFSTYAQLLPNDTDSTKDIYRYDSETEGFDRVSLGENGHDANGNDDTFGATIGRSHVGGGAFSYLQHELRARAMSEDGARIVFSTVEPLSPEATNGLTNVYEWHEGGVSLVSSGNAEESDENATISPSGADIFFQTSQGLLSQDTDGVQDMYDARLGGGFPPVPAQRQPCSGDGCQGALTNPAPLLVPGSVSQAAGENLSPPKKQVTIKKKPKKTKKKPKRARHASAKGKAAIRGRGRR